MVRIYGYRQNDILGLIKFVKENEGIPLSQIFLLYGNKIGKAKGTVRNMYYALAKYSTTDKDFCEKYLDGKPIRVEKIVEFKSEEEKELIEKIISATNGGRSVRSVITELAGGDMKLALRYQNKFRNVLKIRSELKERVENSRIYSFVEPNKKTVKVNEVSFKKLKTEIDNLINRISGKLRRENDYLRSRIAVLETENIRLRNILYGNSKVADAVRFANRTKDETLIN